MNTYQTSNTQGLQPRLLLAATVAATVRSFLLPIARNFQARGWRVDAIANGISKDDVCQSTFDRVWEAKWCRNPVHPKNLMMSSRIRELVSEHQYDIVHVHTPIAGFVTRFALDCLRHDHNLQVIYTAHGFHFHPRGGTIQNKLFEILERKAAHWTDFLIVINREDWAAAKEKRIIGPDRLKFMPGIGVDRSHYSSSSVCQSDLNRLYGELGINGSSPLLLMVAEFTKGKRHVDAILAFSKLLSQRAELLLAGSGPLLDQAKRLAAELGVGDRVHFLGHRNDVPILMKACRALILPSSREGLPRCVLEALSMGVPVIGSRIRGTTELLEQNAGLLADVGDISRLTQAMQLVIADTAAAASMGQAGRRQSERYDLTHILRMHEDLYEEALARRRSTNYDSSQRSVVQM